MIRFSITFFIFLAGHLAIASDLPPKIFVDKGACPFECCTYREWTVEKDTELFDRVGGTKKVGSAAKGSKVIGLTGEVHTIPLKIKDKERGEFYLLTYQGEGFWKIWQNGAVIPDIEVPGLKEGRLPVSTWWVQVKRKDGITGWAKETGNFGNMDSCG